MKESKYKTKMLGVVTLYNPDSKIAAANIKRYIYDLDSLIIWDNSPLENNLKALVLNELPDLIDKIIWKGDGTNYCIAPAINYAWHYAQAHDYELLLIMDQDSQWDNFQNYRKKIDDLYNSGNICVYTPFIKGHDTWTIENEIQPRRIFINSGTVIPFTILDAIQGADETFPLDALDFDLALRIIKRGYQVYCLTSCILQHTIGQPKRSSFLRLYTPDYGPFRTYSTVSSHIINYRKNRKWMTRYERRKVLKEFLFWKIIRIFLAEKEKLSRLKMYFKGIKDGLLFDLNKTKP